MPSQAAILAATNANTDDLIARHIASTANTDDLIKSVSQTVTQARKPNTEVESAFQGALQGASMGFADEIEGAVRAGKQALTGPAKVQGLNDLMNSYQGYRDQARARAELAKKDNPLSFTGGEVAGSLASTAVPGLGWANAAKGATTAARLAAAAKAGAVIGAGTSTADLGKGEVQNLIEDTVQGAATGSAVQGALSGAGAVAQGIADRFRNLPENRAVKAITGQNISALRQISDTTFKSPGDIGAANERIVKVGRDILDEPGVLGPLSKVEDIAPKLADARQKYGKLIGDVGDKIDQLAPQAVNAKNIASNIVDYAASIPETMQGQRLKDKLLEEAANFEKIGALSFTDAQKFKNQFKYKAVDADALISNQDATNKLRGIIGSEMDQTAATLADKGPPEVQDLLKNYALYKSKYGSFKTASDAASDRVQKNLTNRFVSPSDYGVGSAIGVTEAMSHGGPSLSTLAMGAGAAMANKFARERGSALAAKTADTIVKAFDSDGVQGLVTAAKPLIDAARKGDSTAALTFQILNQTNPRVLEIINQQDAMQRRKEAQ